MSSGPQQVDSDEALSEVNVIPLADLSLVLLIILMVLSPMIMQSMIKVQSSQASAIHKRTEKPEPPLILNINPNDVELNGAKITNDLDLASRLASQLGNREDKTVMMTVGSTVPHGRFVQVLDLTKQQGADKIALMRRKDSGAPAQAVATKK